MIYHMSTKTLVKEFTKDHNPEEILDCEFIAFSNRVQGCAKLVYSQRLFFGLESLDENDVNETITSNVILCKRSLKSSGTNLSTCANMVLNAITNPKKTFVILYSPKEEKTLMPKYYMVAIEELLGYPIIDYKNDKYKDFSYKPKRTLKAIDYYIADYKLRSLSLNDFKHCSNKMKKRLLKDVNLYEKSMDEDDMMEVFEDKFWDLPFK